MNDRRNADIICQDEDRRVDCMIRVARIDERVKTLLLDVEEIRAKELPLLHTLLGKHVTIVRYRPVELLVLGFAGLVFSGFVGALVAMVWRGVAP